MNFSDIFINSFGRLRSGWRLLAYVVAYNFILITVYVFVSVIFALTLGAKNAEKFFDSQTGFFFNGLLTLSIATLLGWLLGFFFEGLPFRAIGWGFHRGWLKDFILGSLLGFFTLLIAVAIIMLFGGYQFSFNNAVSTFSIAKTVIVSLIIFIIAAAAEEATFRGYGLQTMARSNILWAWVSIVILSLSFGAVHLRNPNVNFWFTFINTALAGIWLSVAYLKTRSLWFPLGVHWAWNWLMAAVLGIPVSGITSFTPAPLLSVKINSPTWLSGGSYGVEGGIVCGIAVLISTLAIWFLPIVKPTEEMYALTSKENPIETDQINFDIKDETPSFISNE